MQKVVANNFKYIMGLGSVDMTATFRIILMVDPFTYNPDTHDTYGDVSASELATGGGYTQGGEVLAVLSAWAQDNVNDKASIAWNTYVREAVAGDLTNVTAAIVLLYDSVTPASSPVVGAIQFTEPVTITSGSSLWISNLGFDTQGVG